MASYAFRIVNVFTVDGDRFSGNPLCVFEDARGLADGQMQALARQMNLSETTFVLPPAGGGDAHVRIFTPGFEMPFAGHPTLGTASVVARGRDRVVLEMRAGLVEVTTRDGAYELRTAKPPATRAVDGTRAELARMLSLPEAAIAGEPLWVSTGTEQLVIPIASREHVRAARPVVDEMHRLATSPTREEAMAYLWAAGTADDPEHLVRFFFTIGSSVLEDPATGSACANLGGYIVATRHALPYQATLRQGEAVARPSRLHLRVDASGGIFVSGAVIELGRGVVDV
ncbi:MAG TPA: PhzF family phenazine biosynthesis protein [Kofleriaceae bacterium]|nr:PhzF family phenazine biosynthesis protein [Kofleriaceae bacterium]